MSSLHHVGLASPVAATAMRVAPLLTARVRAPTALLQERQRLQHCLKHTLNALLQQPAFTAAQLDRLANELGAQRCACVVAAAGWPAATHPLHRRMLCRTWLLGNWDANVLVAALGAHGLVRAALRGRVLCTSQAHAADSNTRKAVAAG